MVEINLQAILTIIPGHFTIDPFEFTFFADAIERFQTSRVQRSLEIHVLNVKVNVSASLDTFHGEVEPCAEAGILVVRHRVTRQPNVKVVATVHLLTASQVTSIEVTRNGHILLADFELVRSPLRVHISQLLVREVSHNALNALSLLCLRVIVIYVALGVTIRFAI